MFTESVRISCSFMFDISPTLYPDLGSAHLETILSWVSRGLSDTLLVLSYTVTFLSGSTLQPVLYLNTTSQWALHTPTILERKPDCCKYYSPDLVTPCQDGKFSTVESVKSQQDKPGTHHDQP